jgi:glycosyltransferase involved in cell wall biosynthesis
MKNKMLVVYNTCGFSGRESVDWYIKCINSILEQDFEDFRVVVSSVGNTVPVIKKLMSTFGKKISYNLTNERITVNQSFNHTVMKAVEEYGEFDSYLYVDSGIDFGNNKNVLTESYDLLRSGPNGMITIQASNDTGFKEWFGIRGTIKDENFEIPVGRACNLHTQLFSNEIFKAYDNKIIPDIFIAYCTESVFSFVSAGVSQKWIILKDIVLEHLKSVDGATSGFHHIGPRGDSTNNLFGGLDIREIVKNPEAWESGFGYEEMQGVFPHDPSQYDSDGFAKQPERLKEFIRENMFLSKDLFDYDKLKHRFIG